MSHSDKLSPLAWFLMIILAPIWLPLALVVYLFSEDRGRERRELELWQEAKRLEYIKNIEVKKKEVNNE